MYKMIIKLGKRNKMKPPITKLGKAQLELIKSQDFKSENYFHKKKPTVETMKNIKYIIISVTLQTDWQLSLLTMS